MKPLSAIQKRFCEEYIVDLNATKAAIRAGYSEKTARQQASQLLAKDEISEEVAKLKEAQSKRISLNADFVLGELLNIAKTSPLTAFNDNGLIKLIKDIDPDTMRAVSEIETDQYGVVTKIKFVPKIKALEMLGKHLKLFTDKHEVEAGENLAKILSEIQNHESQSGR